VQGSLSPGIGAFFRPAVASISSRASRFAAIPLLQRIRSLRPLSLPARVSHGSEALLLLICLVFFIPGLFTIPPVDRDESRFAQASKQMLESGDFVRIRFQDEARNKKPIGVYWLQAASAALFGPASSKKIWPYRIPSFLGAVSAVLLTFSLGKRLFGEKTAFLATAFTAGSILLVMEAHLATTDAVLLATVVAAQGALSRFYIGRPPPGGNISEQPDRPKFQAQFLVFWTAQAVGLLVKGPVTPLVSFLTIACLAAADRNLRWLKGLRPLAGLSLTALIASPWMIAIAVATKGSFYQQAVVGDFLAKVASGQESHGFPPGFYLLLLPLTLWPASPLAAVSLFRAFHSRAMPAVRFCLAWAAPAWVIFELVPTKLPHYVLPLYPPLCLLVAHTVISAEDGSAPELSSKPVKIGFIACQLALLLLGLGALALPWLVERRFQQIGLVPAIAAISAALLCSRKFLKGRYLQAAAIAIVATALVTAPTLQWILPGLDSLWLSRTVSTAARQSAGENVMLCSAGFQEPSLVFQLGTRTLLTSPEGAALFLEANPHALALVDRSQQEEFKKKADALGLTLKQAGAFYGFNYSKGRTMLLRLYESREPNSE
jgi:4-amino-4-deoxy-L-arabinose transferase-like glycosyltransferase